MKDSSEIQWLGHLLRNGVVELRCFKGDNVKSGVYSKIESLVKNIKLAMSDGWTIYNTINPSNLKATDSILKPFQKSTKNKDITRIKTLFFDFDPVREVGTGATIEQIGDSYRMASKMVAWLKENGFPSPLATGFSGNGDHEYFSVDLSIDDKQLIDSLYKILNKRFNSDLVSFDVSVKNSARIARTFGTINYKCNRRSRCEFNYGGRPVPRGVIESIVKKYAPPKKAPRHFVKAVGENSDGITPDLNILNRISHLSPRETTEANKYWITCINEGQHTTKGDTDTVLWIKENGFYNYHCSHSHCQNLTAKSLQNHLN